MEPASPGCRRNGPLGAEGYGSEPACAGLNSLKMRRLWRHGALQGQRTTRSGERGSYFLMRSRLARTPWRISCSMARKSRNCRACTFSR